MSKIVLSHISLFVANLIYAINYIVAKDVMPEYISPKGFILLRVLGASLLFLLIHKLFIKERVRKKDLRLLLVCSLFGVVINMLCFFEGLSITSPINASLIMIMTPLIVYVLSLVFFIERLSYSGFLGVVLGLLGACILITNGMSFQLNNRGDILVLLNALSYSLYLILIKSMMKKYHPITVLKVLFVIGTIIITPIAWNDIVILNWSHLPLIIILKGVFVIIFTTCVAYFLNIFSLKHLPSSTVAFYIYLQPLLATLIAVVFGKDILTPIKILATVLIFCGVYFVLKRKTI